jgi:hypothetical protein
MPIKFSAPDGAPQRCRPGWPMIVRDYKLLHSPFGHGVEPGRSPAVAMPTASARAQVCAIQFGPAGIIAKYRRHFTDRLRRSGHSMARKAGPSGGSRRIGKQRHGPTANGNWRTGSNEAGQRQRTQRRGSGLYFRPHTHHRSLSNSQEKRPAPLVRSHSKATRRASPFVATSTKRRHFT